MTEITNKNAEFDQILNALTLEEIKNYVIGYAEINESFKNEFISSFTNKNDDQLKIDFYRQEIRNIFRKYANRGYIDYQFAGSYEHDIYEKLTLPAERLCKKGIYYEAFSMVAANILELQEGFECVHYETELYDIFKENIDILQELLSKEIPIGLLQEIYIWLEKEARNPIYKEYVYEEADRLEELRLKTKKIIETIN